MDSAPGSTLEQTPGKGFLVIGGARKGFRLYAVRAGGSETLIDVDLVDGLSWPCTFDSLRLVSNQTDAQLHGGNNEGDDVELVLAIFSDSRILPSIPHRQNWTPRVDVARISIQNIASGATYTVWDDVPIGETGSTPGNGYPWSPWCDRHQPGPWVANAAPHVRQMLIRPIFGFSSQSTIVTAPELVIMAYVDRDSPGSGEWMYERLTWQGILYRGTQYYVINANRSGSVTGQAGLIWPSGGARLEINNPAANGAINFSGFFGFVGQT